LIAIVQRHVISSIYVVVDADAHKHFADVTQQLMPGTREQRAGMRTAYELAGYIACRGVSKWVMDHKEHASSLIRIVFDHGHQERHWLEKGYERMYANRGELQRAVGLAVGLPESLNFENMRAVRPLQAADLWAYELGKRVADGNAGKEKERLSFSRL